MSKENTIAQKVVFTLDIDEISLSRDFLSSKEFENNSLISVCFERGGKIAVTSDISVDRKRLLLLNQSDDILISVSQKLQLATTLYKPNQQHSEENSGNHFLPKKGYIVLRRFRKNFHRSGTDSYRGLGRVELSLSSLYEELSKHPLNGKSFEFNLDIPSSSQDSTTTSPVIHENQEKLQPEVTTPKSLNYIKVHLSVEKAIPFSANPLDTENTQRDDEVNQALGDSLDEYQNQLDEVASVVSDNSEITTVGAYFGVEESERRKKFVEMTLAEINQNNADEELAARSLPPPPATAPAAAEKKEKPRRASFFAFGANKKDEPATKVDLQPITLEKPKPKKTQPLQTEIDPDDDDFDYGMTVAVIDDEKEAKKQANHNICREKLAAYLVRLQQRDAKIENLEIELLKQRLAQDQELRALRVKVAELKAAKGIAVDNNGETDSFASSVNNGDASTNYAELYEKARNDLSELKTELTHRQSTIEALIHEKREEYRKNEQLLSNEVTALLTKAELEEDLESMQNELEEAKVKYASSANKLDKFRKKSEKFEKAIEVYRQRVQQLGSKVGTTTN